MSVAVYSPDLEKVDIKYAKLKTFIRYFKVLEGSWVSLDLNLEEVKLDISIKELSIVQESTRLPALSLTLVQA